MTDHYITIGTKVDPKNGVNLISVSDQWVTVKNGDSVVFNNLLDGDVDANVAFFATPDKAAPIMGFCEGKVGTTLLVPAGQEEKCGITQGGEQWIQIAYAVETSASDPMKHVALDPVIIIEPRKLQKELPGGAGTPFMTILGALIVGLVLGFLVRGMSGPRGSR